MVHQIAVSQYKPLLSKGTDGPPDNGCSRFFWRLSTHSSWYLANVGANAGQVSDVLTGGGSSGDSARVWRHF